MTRVKTGEQKEVFIIADNILSPIGHTTAENFTKLKNGVYGVRPHHNPALAAQPVMASLFNADEMFASGSRPYTKFEQLLIASMQNAMQSCSINAADPKTGLIICSTKGNISLLETEAHTRELNKRIALRTSAALIKEYFGFVNEALIISNACISGVLGIINGMRLLQSGRYQHVVVTGADVISRFVVSGFQSFRALSAQPCRPFDQRRDGLNLGEGAGTIVLSTQKTTDANIRVTGGATSNDANHISGPSRTGQELGYAIKQALKGAALPAEKIDFIAAHGTATVYNDEMEANAVAAAGLQATPLFSLKPNYGHTLGAAGLIETIAALHCLKEDIILPSPGYEQPGVSCPVHVNTSVISAPLKNALKTASGFGGCNAALVLSK